MERHLTRQPAVAGAFYPGSRGGLLSSIDECFLGSLGPGSLPTVPDKAAEKTLGLVSPHAGYMYSGPCAAHGFARAARAGRFETVVVIGPNHHGWGAPVALFPSGEFATPLGTVTIDEERTSSLAAITRAAVLDETAHRAEHSVEVQLPFIQRVWQQRVPRLLALVMAQQRIEVALELGGVIAQVFQDEPVLLVASTDFTHYRPKAFAERQDKFALDKILALDGAGLLEEVARRNISMCGYGPVATVLEAGKRLGCSSAELVNYMTSGDVTGDFSDIVAYASVVVT